MEVSKSGYIYVLQMEGHNYFKIGRTCNLSRRITQISPQMPGRLILVFAHKVRDTWVAERNLHEDFQDKRLNGEWFHLDRCCLEEIEGALLFHQSLWLFRRLLETVSYDDPAFTRTTKTCRLLYKAAIRRERRFRKYADCMYARKARESDGVVEAILTEYKTRYAAAQEAEMVV